jgi:hypothetical protein
MASSGADADADADANADEAPGRPVSDGGD